MYFLIHHSKILIKEQTLPPINMTLKKHFKECSIFSKKIVMRRQAASVV